MTMGAERIFIPDKHGSAEKDSRSNIWQGDFASSWSVTQLQQNELERFKGFEKDLQFFRNVPLQLNCLACSRVLELQCSSM